MQNRAMSRVRRVRQLPHKRRWNGATEFLFRNEETILNRDFQQFFFLLDEFFENYFFTSNLFRIIFLMRASLYVFASGTEIYRHCLHSEWCPQVLRNADLGVNLYHSWLSVLHNHLFHLYNHSNWLKLIFFCSLIFFRLMKSRFIRIIEPIRNLLVTTLLW